jgi:hypothetical protein
VANLDTWFSVAVAFVTVAIAWLTYRNQSNRKQLEYLVVSVQQLVSPRVATDLAILCVPNSDVDLEFWLTLSPRWCSLDFGPHLAPTLDA